MRLRKVASLYFTVLLLATLSFIPAHAAAAQKSAARPSSGPDLFIKDFDYSRLAQAVAAMPPSPDRDYFAGVLANRDGHIDDSIRLLTKVIPQLESSNPARAAIALRSLADDYTKGFRYNHAIHAYRQLFPRFASQFDKQERKSATDDYQLAVLLHNWPPQTVSFDGSIDLATQRNPVLGTIETSLTVNGVTAPWILDTGANVSTISASFARKLGLKLSKGSAKVDGITGAANPLHVALLPELKVGGATVRNVLLLVLNDDSLSIPIGKNQHYQINAILGFPVFQALQRITFTADGHFLAGPGSPSSVNGAHLYMYQLTPLLQCNVENRTVLFSFDTGAGSTIFSQRYHADFPDQFKGLTKKPYGIGGAGGVRQMDAYFLPQVQLGIGDDHAVLHKVAVVPRMGTHMDKLYGNLGRDLVDPYRSYTIDLANMRFKLGEKLPAISKSK